MDTITIVAVIGIIAVLAIIFGNKASAPGLFQSVLFLLGLGSVILVSVDTWVSSINWVVNNSKSLFGMAEEKFNVEKTIGALKSGSIDRSTAGTVTISGIGAVLALRFFSVLIALLLGIVSGIILKAWLLYFNIHVGGVI